ncbi:uncharacterized protein LOC118450903 [Vespa mandarinia]|uniref:uncharacterized protein LOC118450903 n=1 Tax=Vespa mandarinia TaxID=7446 RepID=UPI00161468FA|nr:uncharacterized protein LOC118450903 [Vespa mandarinia]
MLLNQVMRKVISWMEDHGLSQASQKTEIVLFTKKRNNTLQSFILGDAAIKTKSAVKYIGIMLDKNLNYGEHIFRAADKAAKIVASLGTLMANVNRSRLLMRRLQMRATKAVMLHGTEEGRSPNHVFLPHDLCSHGASVRGGGTDQSTSTGEKIPPQLKALSGNGGDIKLAGSTSIETWQSSWEQEHRGRWTVRLTSQLVSWLNREAEEVDFYLTQFLIRHFGVYSYITKMRKVADGNCPYGDFTVDNTHHTYFKCARWSVERLALEKDFGKYSPNNVVEKMLRGQEEWNKVA